jgi:hypothetical protein
MQISDAAKLLSLSGNITPELVKKAYHNAEKKYHPDVNPAGAEMMKIINNAFETLENYTGAVLEESSNNEYPEALNAALMSVMPLDGLIIEICGAWVWVTGDTRKHKEILKTNGFKYASKKKAWNFRPDDWKSRSRGKSSLEEIREKYGSNTPNMPNRKRLA